MAQRYDGDFDDRDEHFDEQYGGRARDPGWPGRRHRARDDEPGRSHYAGARGDAEYPRFGGHPEWRGEEESERGRFASRGYEVRPYGRSSGPGRTGFATDPQTGRHFGRGPKGYHRSDERIREDVCDRLTADPEVDARDLTVNVTNCEVTLEGTVPDRRMKRCAEDCAEDVPGVSQVHNRLRVRSGQESEEAGAGKGRTAAAGRS